MNPAKKRKTQSDIKQFFGPSSAATTVEACETCSLSQNADSHCETPVKHDDTSRQARHELYVLNATYDEASVSPPMESYHPANDVGFTIQKVLARQQITDEEI